METCQKKKTEIEYQRNSYKFIEKNKKEMLKQYQKDYFNSNRTRK